MKDKFLHFFASMIGVMVLNIYLEINLAMGIAFLLGALKEVYDWKIKKTKFDISDIAADIGGILVGAILLQLK